MLLYLLVADGERGAQLFLAAVTRHQADVAWRDALAMVDASPHLRALLDRRANNLAVEEDGSFLRPVSSEKRGLDGKRVAGALVDELHEHPNGIVVNKMRAGTKGRRNAMIIKATNSGFNRTSVCFQHHTYCARCSRAPSQTKAGSRSSAGSIPARPASTPANRSLPMTARAVTSGASKGHIGGRAIPISA